MILRCLVVTITRNRKGQPIRAGKLVTGDPITVGRSAESTIYLPDPRVNLHHAIIRNDDLGKLHVEANEAPLDVDGQNESRTKLRRGARILIGPYQISPEPPTGSDHDFALAVELVLPLPEGLNELREYSRTSLSATWLSKRALAWALFAGVGTLCLALPMAHATSPRFREVAVSSFPESLKRVPWDGGWDPGPLSVGHQPLTQHCDACHQVPFEPVPDRACIKCHQGTGEHVLDAALRTGALGARCAECHRDHKGETGLVRTDSQLCVDCHGDIKARSPKTTLFAITDFADDHPGLSLSILNAETGESERVPAERVSSTREASGLKFPHEKHLATAGIRSPSGLRVLGCPQCHRPDADGLRFTPVKMADDCAECHQLNFEPAVSTREAPHGDPGSILTTLREFYARVALADRPIDVRPAIGLLGRPGAGETRPAWGRGLAWADQKAQAVATEMIETRVCGQCHHVSRTVHERRAGSDFEGPIWTIQPVSITARWVSGVLFDHRTHQQPGCEKCHDVRSSKSSEDISMPTLATCRSCHAGTVAVTGKVRSPCETCHSFHQHPRPGALPATSSAFQPDAVPQGAPAPR